MKIISGTICKKGYYKCKNCGTEVLLQKSSTLPPCPTCGLIEFEKSDKI